MLRNPCILGGPQQRGQNQKWQPHPTFSGAQERTEVLHSPCILGDPQQRGKNQKWLPHPCLLVGPPVGTSATQPLHSRGSPTKGTKSEMAASPLPSRGPTRRRKCYDTPAFSAFPRKGDENRSGYLTPTFSEAHQRTKVLQNPCILGGPQTKGTKSEVAASPLPSQGPTRGRKCHVTLAFSGVPNKGGKIRSAWLNPRGPPPANV